MEENSVLTLYRHSSCTQSISKKEIVKICSDINYSKIYLLNGKSIVIARTLKTFETTLSQNNQFLRPSKSLLINTAYIKKFTLIDNIGRLLLIDGTNITISRRRLKLFKTKFFINQ